MTVATGHGATAREGSGPPDPAEELRQALTDIESGNYLELTPEQLDELVEKGSLPELDEWLASPD